MKFNPSASRCAIVGVCADRGAADVRLPVDGPVSGSHHSIEGRACLVTGMARRQPARRAVAQAD